MSNGDDLLNQILSIGSKKPAGGEGLSSPKGSTTSDEELLSKILNEPSKKGPGGAASPPPVSKEEEDAILTAIIGEKPEISKRDLSHHSGGTASTSVSPERPRAGSVKSNSLDDEGLILEAMLKAIQDDENSVDSGDLGLDFGDVDRVIDHASRIARGEVELTEAPKTARGHVGESHNHLLTFTTKVAMLDEIHRAQSSTGFTTCFAVSNGTEFKFATGTTFGIVLLYNAAGKVCSVCGNVSELNSTEHNRGSVTCLSMVPSGEAVLAGYEKGHVIWWESRTAQIIKVVTATYIDPVLRISIFEDVFKVASTNQVGTVKLYSLNRVMMKWVCRDQVVEHRLPYFVTDIAAIPSMETGPIAQPSSHDTLHFLAIACKECVKVFCIQFGAVNFDISEIFSVESPTFRTDAMATTAVTWKAPLGHHDDGNGHITDQYVLCIAWSTSLTLYRLVPTLNGMDGVGSLTIPFAVGSLYHLTADCVGGFSSIGEMLVADVKNVAIVDVCSHSGFEPMVKPRNVMHQHCVGGDGHSLYACNTVRFLSVDVKTWTQRINNLATQKMWGDALELALQCYNNSAVGLVGLSENEWTRKEQVSTCMNQLINQYVAHEVAVFVATKQTDPTKRLIFFHTLGKKLIALCVSIKSWEMLFGPVFGVFARENEEDIFVYLLEDFVSYAESDDMRITGMPEFFVDALFKLYLSPEAKYKALDEALGAPEARRAMVPFDRVEACMMRLTTSVEHALKKVTSTKMYKAMCMLYCIGMVEYSLPMTQLLAIDTPESLSAMMEYQIVVYKGETFVPGHRVPPSVSSQLHQDILIHSCTKDVMEKLLRINVGKFLQILDCVLFDQEVWELTNIGETRQGVIDRLIGLTIDVTSEPTEPWSLMKRGWPAFEDTKLVLLHQLQYIVARVVTFDRLDQHVTRAIAALCYKGTEASVPLTPNESMYRQNIIANVLRSRVRPEGLNYRTLLQYAEEASFHTVVVAIHEIQGKLKQALLHLLKSAKANDVMKDYLFAYVDSSMMHFKASGMESEATQLSNAVVDNIVQMIEMDSNATSRAIMLHFSNRHEDILKNLKENPAALFHYLYGLIFRHKELADQVPEETLSLSLKSTDAANAIDFTDPHMQNTFIQLLCQHQPDDVYNYLLENDNKFVLDIEHVMQVCQKYKVIDAQVFLLEKTNQISQAMKLLILSLTNKMQKMRKDIILSTSREELSMNSFAEVKKFVDVGVQLCVRNYQHLDEKEADNVWFALLDRFVRPRQALGMRLKCEEIKTPLPTGQEEDFNTYNELDPVEAAAAMTSSFASPPASSMPKGLTTNALGVYKCLFNVYSQNMKYIMSFMMKHVLPATIWGKIQRDHPTDNYGEFKWVLQEIIEHSTYSLAATLCCDRIMKNDTYRLGEALRKVHQQPICNQGDTCTVCLTPLGSKDSADSLRYYSCGHLFHDYCCPYARCVTCSNESKGKAAPAASKAKSGGNAGGNNNNSNSPSKELDDKALKKILRNLDRARRRLEIPAFVDAAALCDDTTPLAAALRTNQRKGHVQLNLIPVGNATGDLPDPVDRLPGKLPRDSKVTTVLREDELIEIFGDSTLERCRELKAEKQRKKAIEAKTQKILSSNVDEGGLEWVDDADALAWDS